MAVNIASLIDKRIAKRRQLTGLLPGKLIIKDQRNAISCRPVDVSPEGLGILTTEFLAPGQELTLILKDKTLELQVAWGQPDFAKREIYRYGLIVVSGVQDLEKLFEETGCLR